ncbi:alpha/beta fold hydrolase [Reichenbachiella ulvae]|uniref:Alpha/beta hydrolase n=1 Tax=Reichenbachiella ulvae TaxID=2980104 RepID=A0ABT3CY39_9BACT|nr:alpha/beta hydrolase [Reichenbachiella ulvae]MCV9388463.1 alpha/beta hydrolase [Reichenbachiella ulvae]
MNLKISGSGKTIVFLHGYCESLEIWTEFANELSKNHQVVLIDLPGHGQSEILAGDFSIEDVARAIHEQLDIEGIEEYFVIGHSLGGYVALALAELFPDSLTGFGLFSSSIYADDEEKKKVRDKVKSYVEEYGVESFMETFIAGLFASENRKCLKEEIDELKQRAIKTPAAGVTGYAMAMKNRPDREHVLNNFEKPVFIIAGEKDLAVRLDVSLQMIEKINNGDSIVLKGAGHNGFMENKKESLEFIKSFINQYL